MINLSNFSYGIFYCLNYFSLRYNKIILINKYNNNYVKLNFIYTFFYNLLIFISNITLFKNELNKYFNNYHIVYKYNDKYHLSNSFIIKDKKDISSLVCSNVQSIFFEFKNNSKINLLTKIKEYDNDFSIVDFLKINDINHTDLYKVVIEYIPIFNIDKKELFFDDIKKEKINYLLKN